jgi:hypothetical protein
VKSSIIIICLLLPALLWAEGETPEKNWLVGTDFSLSNMKADIVSYSNDDILEWGLCPKIQRMVSDHLAIGLTGSISRLEQDDIRFNKFGIGPSVSLYSNPEKRSGPFIEFSYTSNYLQTRESDNRRDYSGAYDEGGIVLYSYYKPLVAADHYRSEFGLQFGYMLRLSDTFSLTFGTTMEYIAGSGLPPAPDASNYERLVAQDAISIDESMTTRQYDGAGFSIRLGILTFL